MDTQSLYPHFSEAEFNRRYSSSFRLFLSSCLNEAGWAHSSQIA